MSIWLSKNAYKVFQVISEWDFLHDYMFIGGSALAVQIKHRLSEDLDFCKWKRSKNDKQSIDIREAENYLSKFGLDKMNILGFDQVDFLLKDNVKVSFYAITFTLPR